MNKNARHRAYLRQKLKRLLPNKSYKRIIRRNNGARQSF